MKKLLRKIIFIPLGLVIVPLCMFLIWIDGKENVLAGENFKNIWEIWCDIYQI